MNEETENKKKTISSLGKAYQEMSVYLGLGTQLVATIVFMVFLGKWLDDYFETTPLLIIIFSMFGGFAGIYNFIKTTLNLNDKKKNPK